MHGSGRTVLAKENNVYVPGMYIPVPYMRQGCRLPTVFALVRSSAQFSADSRAAQLPPEPVSQHRLRRPHHIRKKKKSWGFSFPQAEQTSSRKPCYTRYLTLSGKRNGPTHPRTPPYATPLPSSFIHALYPLCPLIKSCPVLPLRRLARHRGCSQKKQRNSRTRSSNSRSILPSTPRHRHVFCAKNFQSYTETLVVSH